MFQLRLSTSYSYPSSWTCSSDHNPFEPMCLNHPPPPPSHPILSTGAVMSHIIIIVPPVSSSSQSISHLKKKIFFFSLSFFVLHYQGRIIVLWCVAWEGIPRLSATILTKTSSAMGSLPKQYISAKYRITLYLPFKISFLTKICIFVLKSRYHRYIQVYMFYLMGVMKFFC